MNDKDWVERMKFMVMRGDTVHVHSTRKDCNFDGEVIATGHVTLTVASKGRSRAYPWAQVAYVEKKVDDDQSILDEGPARKIAVAIVDDQDKKTFLSIDERKERIERYSAIVGVVLSTKETP